MINKMKIDGSPLSPDEQGIYSAAFTLEAKDRVMLRSKETVRALTLNEDTVREIHKKAAEAVRWYRFLHNVAMDLDGEVRD